MAKTKIVSVVRSILEHAVEMVTLVLFLFLILIGFYAFYDAGSVTRSSALGDDILAVSPENDDDGYMQLAGAKEINSDIIGWVKIFDTSINHPVLYSGDNDTYLSINYKKEYSAGGSAFVDYRNNKFNDAYTVVYGHRMSDGMMFSDITRYTDEDYFKQHLTGKLWTDDATYDLQILGFGIFNVGEVNIYDVDILKSDSNLAFSEVSKSFMYRSGYEFETGDKLILLSTCDNAGRHKRDVLLAKLAKQ